MEVFLTSLLPSLLSNIPFQIHPFQCKHELLRELPNRLRAYARWLPETHRIVVVLDRDNDDCHELKARLNRFASEAGLSLRNRRAHKTSFAVVNRIAIEELEAWYFGDWSAVRNAYPRVSPSIPRKASYREPDAIAGGTWEAFERILQMHGYMEQGLRKTEAARTIAPLMDPGANTSRSFQIFRDTLYDIAGT